MKVDRHLAIEKLKNEILDELTVPGLIGDDKTKNKFPKLKDYISHSNEEMIEGFASMKKALKSSLEEFNKEIAYKST